jgi:hypothetical protein
MDGINLDTFDFRIESQDLRYMSLMQIENLQLQLIKLRTRLILREVLDCTKLTKEDDLFVSQSLDTSYLIRSELNFRSKYN